MGEQVPSRDCGPEAHELAALFPPMTPDEFAALKADIARQGLRDPITTSGGEVVDGRYRLHTCRELDIEPRFVEWDGAGSLVDLVVGRNLHRRHLDESQRAMVAARVAGLARGRPANNARERAILQAEAARMAKVGRTSVQQARKVQRRGVPELARAVDRGEVSVAAAARIAGLDATEQERIVAAGPAAARGAARPARRPGQDEAPAADRTEGAAIDAGAVAVERDDAARAAQAAPRADRAWLEGLPLWVGLRDTAAFEREALAWRELSSILDRARRADPGFDGSLPLRLFRAHRPQLLAHLAGLEHPGRWKACSACGGSGGAAGPGRCSECHGDGFEITRREDV